MMAKLISSILLAASLFIAIPAFSTEVGMPLHLSRDPFAHPVLVQVSAPSPPTVVKVDDADVWKEKIHLQAIMITRKWTIANVNGKLLTPGESVEGYKLVKVMERKVLFRKDGRDILVRMDNE